MGIVRKKKKGLKLYTMGMLAALMGLVFFLQPMVALSSEGEGSDNGNVIARDDADWNEYQNSRAELASGLKLDTAPIGTAVKSRVALYSVANLWLSKIPASTDGGLVNHDSAIYKNPTINGSLLSEIAANKSNEFAYGSARKTNITFTGIVNSFYTSPIYSMGANLQAMEYLWGISLGHVIYGRVMGYGSAVVAEPSSGPNAGKLVVYRSSLFTYELTKGNAYGYVSMIIYTIMRGLCMVLLVCVFMSRLAVAAVRNTGKELDDLRHTVSNYIIVSFLLYLMPYALDLAIFIRDSMLYAVGVECLKNFGSIDFFEMFNVSYWSNGCGFMDACLCVAAPILALYFAISYISTALGMTVGVVIFPFVCVTSSFDKDAIVRWVKEMIGYLVVPVIDSVLIIIVLVIGNFSGAGFLQFLVCMMVIPARQSIRNFLGLGSQSGLDRMAGSMMGLAALQFGRAISGLVSKVKSSVSAAGEADDMAALEQGYADAENADFMDAVNQTMGQGMYDSSDENRQLGAERIASMFGGDPHDVLWDEQTGQSAYFSSKDMENSLFNEASDYKSAAEDDTLTAEFGEATKANAAFEAQNSEYQALIDDETIKMNDEKLSAAELRKRNAELEAEKMDATSDEEREEYARQIADNKVQIADYEAEAQWHKNNIDSYKQHKDENSAKIKENKELINQYKQRSAQNRRRANELSKEAERIRREGGYSGGGSAYGGRGSSYGGGGHFSSAPVRGRGGTPLSNEEYRRMHDVELRFANAMNFDNGNFGTLTHQEKADLYRKRASRLRVKAATTAASGVVGAGAGFATSMFFGAQTKGVMMLAGGSMGMAASEVVNDATYKRSRFSPGEVAYYSGRSVMPTFNVHGNARVHEVPISAQLGEPVYPSDMAYYGAVENVPSSPMEYEIVPVEVGAGMKFDVGNDVELELSSSDMVQLERLIGEAWEDVKNSEDEVSNAYEALRSSVMSRRDRLNYIPTEYVDRVVETYVSKVLRHKDV